jgi:hypothetical protein
LIIKKKKKKKKHLVDKTLSLLRGLHEEQQPSPA